MVGGRETRGGDVQIDAELVQRLIAEQFPEWTGLPIGPVYCPGTDNALCRLGDDLVVRMPRRERPSVTLTKEVEWLPRIAPLLPVAVPVPVGVGLPNDDYPFGWSVYRWLSGTDAASGVVRDAHEFAADLTRVISSLRLIDTEGAPSPGEHNFFRGVPLERRDGATRAAIAALAATVDSAEVTSAWEVSLSAPRWDGSPVWIHGDLDARNLILSDGRLSGVVDWGGLGVGDPACDVMVAWKCFGVEERGIFRSAVAVDDATWVRARGWALSQALNALSYYTPQTNYVLVREAQRWLVEVLADHRSEVRGGS